MKNKVVVIALALFVLAIWSYAFLQFRQITQSNQQANAPTPQQSFVDSLNYFDGKELALNYTDPFDMQQRRNQLYANQSSLSKVSRVVVPAVRNEISTPRRQPARQIINWPQLTIKGIIKENNGTVKSASLFVNGVPQVVQPNDAVAQEFIIHRIDADSIYLRHQSEIKGYAIP